LGGEGEREKKRGEEKRKERKGEGIYRWIDFEVLTSVNMIERIMIVV
jgi:hypothetical protein